MTGVSNPGFPELDTRIFSYFLSPETRFFSTTKLAYFKNLELLLHSKVVILITLKLQIGACNGQIIARSNLNYYHEARDAGFAL